MKNKKISRIINVILVIFLIVQPLCDIYMGVIGEDLDILGISIVTFLRTITTVSLVVVVGISQIIYKHKLKWLYTLLGYLALVGIYATFHHYNIVNSGGYYITNGKAIKIKCHKASRKAQTIYKDLNGNEIDVNDGNTFIQIVPTNSKVKIEPGEIKNKEIANNIIENKNAIN